MEINVGYAVQELLAALATSESHEDPEVRARARKQAEKWKATIAGMQRGELQVGSRTPTKAPAWVTLEVVTGGFATGSYLAGGALRPHELALAKELGLPASRLALNLHLVGSEKLRELLASGAYRIEVPEEGALLVVAWLRQRGQHEQAAALLAELAPWLSELRFYPAPNPAPIATQASASASASASPRDPNLEPDVRLQDLAITRANIAKERRQPRFEAMRAALTVWAPLADRALALLAETAEEPLPHLDNGKLSGGQIAKRFPPGWAERVRALVQDRGRAGKAHTRRAAELSEQIGLLARLAASPTALDARELARLRRDLVRHLTAHGLPGSPQHTVWRAEQARAVAGPLHADLRRVVVARLAPLPGDGGLELERAAAPVSAAEAARFPAPAGSALPPYLVDKLARSWDAPLDALVARGVIPSSESLAGVLPQLTSQVRAQSLPDATSRHLYAAVYRAFRLRRGLLLLDYQHQVRVEELPWIAALDRTRVATHDASQRARAVVAAASATALAAFPHTIVPNKLVTELASLCTAAELALPLLEELAADIFMGSFTSKFVAAAQTAATLLRGSLYQRYYDVDPEGLLALSASGRLANDFATLCSARAAAINGGGGYGVAANGKIIEQAQILTTHNLAVLFDALALDARLRDQLRATAERCLRWILQQLAIPARSGHEVLIRLKNTAYAWRQMIFFLSFVDDAPGFARWARERLAAGPAELRARFEPALRGLELCAAGRSSSEAAFRAAGARVFTGWSTERHWLSPSALAP